MPAGLAERGLEAKAGGETTAGAGVNSWTCDAEPGLEGQACWLSWDCRPGLSVFLESVAGCADGPASAAGFGLPLPWAACLPAIRKASACHFCEASPWHQQSRRSLILYLMAKC